jgi:S1-C subfamily serine protease
MRIFALLMIAAATRIAAQRCSEGRSETGTIGIGRYQCVTGTGCMVDTRAHVFSTEPTVWKIKPRGPSAAQLRDGDALVAVDGQLITTRAGGERMANIQPGERVTLRIRRAGVESDVSITAVRGCNTPSLVVLTPGEATRYGNTDKSGVSMRAALRRQLDDTFARRPSDLAAPIELGVTLECGDCRWRQDNGRWRFETTRPPFVQSVDSTGPAFGRLDAGDVILAINKRPIIDAAAGLMLGAARPGESFAIEVWRRGRVETITLVPRHRGGR